jgi:hypothetical protein
MASEIGKRPAMINDSMTNDYTDGLQEQEELG